MKDIIKKWWFWLIILAIIIVIGITIIMLKAFDMALGEVEKLAIEIQNIYEDATIYSSAGENTLVLELNNWSNSNTEELNKIINTVKNKIKDNKLQSYSKFVTLAYLESSNKENVLFIKTTYNLPDFTKEEELEYIMFSEYQDLYKTLSNTMDGYTNLYNSIY